MTREEWVEHGKSTVRDGEVPALHALPVHSITDELLRIRTARTDIHAAQPVMDAIRYALDPATNPKLAVSLQRVRFGKVESVFHAELIHLWSLHLSIHYGVDTAIDLAREIACGDSTWESCITVRSAMLPGEEAVDTTPRVQAAAIREIKAAFRRAGLLSDAEAADKALCSQIAEEEAEAAAMSCDGSEASAPAIAGSMFDTIIATEGPLTPGERLEAARDEKKRRRATRKSRQNAALRGAGRAPKRKRGGGSKRAEDVNGDAETAPKAAGVLSYFSKSS